MSCKRDKLPGPDDFAFPNMTREEIPSLTDKDITMIVTENGVMKMKLEAPIASSFDKARVKYNLYKQGIHVQTFLPDGTLDSEIKSDYAIYWDAKQLWELSSNVVAINSKGEKFETELLFWDQKSEQVYSNEFIKITNSERIITGNGGFRSDQNMTKYTIEKVTGIFPVNLDK